MTVRPKLSNGLHLTAEEILLKPPSLYHDNNIEVLLEKEVIKFTNKECDFN